VSDVLIGLLSALVATNQPAAVSNLIVQTTGITVNVPDPNDPVEKELAKLMREDDVATAEVDDWIRENQKFATQGAAVPKADLNRRIMKRFEPVRQGYESLIQKYPTNASVRVAYASFLKDLGDEDAEKDQLEKARELDPKDPAVWNNLANYYGEFSPLSKAFDYYQKAIELDPTEAVYYWNFATTVYLYRKDAREYFHFNEQQVFDKSLDLYAQALQRDPTNFVLATDLAESYYGIKPARTEAALVAWTNAMQIASTEIEREGVHIHLARVKLYYAGRFSEARAHLNVVTNEMYAELKRRLTRNLDEREKAAAGTNGPPPKASESD
jgi:tetratricopeptide (TPR) repeat protein